MQNRIMYYFNFIQSFIDIMNYYEKNKQLEKENKDLKYKLDGVINSKDDIYKKYQNLIIKNNQNLIIKNNQNLIIKNNKNNIYSIPLISHCMLEWEFYTDTYN